MKKRLPYGHSWLLIALNLLAGGCALQAATSGTFANPIITDGADPWVVSRDGFYYYTQTTGYSVTVRKAATITGLGTATPVTVFLPGAPANQNVWAPELHFLSGKWYIYYAADDGNNANHRMYVAEAATGDPQGAYTFIGKIYDANDDRWAIDGTVLEKDDGSLYFIWSGWPGTSNLKQNIYIAPMSNPWTISGSRVLLSRPELSWEINPDTSAPLINEGPEVIKRNGKLFIVYSANKAWEDYYCLGLLVNITGDVLNPTAWTKLPNAVFSSLADETGAVYGPGHCSFTRNMSQTEDWIVYHAAKHSGAGFNRNVRAQAFAWNTDDTPFFGAPITTSLPVIFPAGEAPANDPSPGVTNGLLQLEIYTAISGDTLADLTNHPKFPMSPDLTRYVGQFEMPTNLGNHYGARLSGYVIAPATGSYVFYLCSASQGALFLSTNGDPASKQQIAFEPQWNNARDWTGTARRPAQENISAPVLLQTGQRCYVEALVKAGGGVDNLGVAWSPPGGGAPQSGSPPIAGAYLAIPFIRTSFSLTATATPGGSVARNPDQPTYASNSVVMLTAAPEAGFVFAGWSGAANGTNSPLPVTMTANKSLTAHFVANPADVVVDNTNASASFSGSWQTGVIAPGHYGDDYRYAQTASGGQSNATYRGHIAVPGYYDVYIWYSEGSNRATNAPWQVSCADGSVSVPVNQQTNGGTWLRIAAAKPFNEGTNGFVRLSNETGYAGKVVIADAVRFVLVSAFATPPTIVAHPQSQTARAGTNVTFSVAAAGSDPLSYQWKFNGADISGATAASFVRNNVQPGDAGAYSAVVSNAAGVAGSSNAVLTVTLPDPFRFESVASQPDGSVKLAIRGEAGASFWIDRSEGLAAWWPLTNLVNSNGIVVFTDVSATNAGARFYRTRQ